MEENGDGSDVQLELIESPNEEVIVVNEEGRTTLQLQQQEEEEVGVKEEKKSDSSEGIDEKMKQNEVKEEEKEKGVVEVKLRESNEGELKEKELAKTVANGKNKVSEQPSYTPEHNCTFFF